MLIRAIVFLLLLQSSLSHADLISMDWKTIGDGLITLDTDTGLEWLDITEAAGRGVSDILGVDGTNEFHSGGDFDGFRYALTEEVLELFDNFGVVQFRPTHSTADYATAALFQSFLGYNEACCTTDGYATHLTQGYSWSGYQLYFNAPSVNVDPNIKRADVGIWSSDTYLPTNIQPPLSHWLVKGYSVHVPEPSPALLFLIGLLPLFRKSFISPKLV